MLLAHKASIAKAEDNEGFTCLMAACTNYDTAVLELLLKHGGDVHARDKTPGVSEGWTALFWACHESNDKALEVLISHGAVVADTDKKGRGPLRIAANKGGIGIMRALLSHGSDVNAADDEVQY